MIAVTRPGTVMTRLPSYSCPAIHNTGDAMYLAASGPVVAGLGILYVVLLITLGIISIRKGHWVLFIIGLFIPLFWFIGALLPPTRAR